MSIRKVGEIEIYETDKHINEYSRKEREKYVNELFKEEYIGKEISYLLNDKEIKALINQTTRKNFNALSHHGIRTEKRKAFNIEHDIAFSGDYISFVSNAKYSNTNKEFKAGQNKNHREDNLWHNFTKTIIFNNIYFNLTINVRELNNKFFIHNTKLKEIKKEADKPSNK